LSPPGAGRASQDIRQRRRDALAAAAALLLALWWKNGRLERRDVLALAPSSRSGSGWDS
jgi:hypothetical protein